MPKIWNVDVNNAVGIASIPEKHKVVSKEVSNKLCQLIGDIKLKANESSNFLAFRDSLISDGDYKTK